MPNGLDLKYDDYVTWYESARRKYLEPAQAQALRLVDTLLDEKVDPIDRARFRISSSRVKSTQRSFAKLNNEKYRSRILTYDNIPEVIDDLVGLRLVCNNLSDINTLQEIFGELPTGDGKATGLSLEENSQRDYFSDPKISGYRAYHVNLLVQVAQTVDHRQVRVEVQARTLLQDGWGELTHEDTYKPGSTVPSWIVSMSARMAELLAAVDNIAQDLRTGLDVETQRSVETPTHPQSDDAAHAGKDNSSSTEKSPHEAGTQGPIGPDDHREDRESEIEAALIKEAQRLAGELRTPAPLASIAQELNATFGTDITRTWAGTGGFKRFIETYVPSATISGPAPGYMHPKDTPVPANWTTEGTGSDTIPNLVRELRAYDKEIPQIGADRLKYLVESVTKAVRELRSAEDSERASAPQIGALAKRAKEEAIKSGSLVVLPHTLYTLRAINNAGRLTNTLSSDDVREILLNKIVDQGRSESLIKDETATLHELRAWLGIDAGAAEARAKTLR